MNNITYTNYEGKETTLEETLKEKFGDTWHWVIGKNTIISHDAICYLAYVEKIKVIGTPRMEVQPSNSNHQQHVCFVKVGRDDTWTWTDVGEASRLNTGKFELVKGESVYREHRYSDGKPVIDSNYRASMAFKRAFDRAVLGFLGIRNKVYSSSESAVFESKDNNGIYNY
jgi:hypothetical protein